jgi:NAD dependent epimerase/dehydratase family enzyme
MAHSYSPTESGALAQTSDARRRVLVTGAAGNIGSYFAEHSNSRYEFRLMVKEIDDDARAIEKYGELVACDLGDLEKLKEICTGIDTVVHLAGNPSPSQTWSSVVDNNITGTYNVCVAAKAAGCRRLIYASSIHAVSGYPSDVQVKTSEPVNPGDLYGVSKCFGEALGRYMAEQEGLSVIALRIGAFQPLENAVKEDVNMMDGWVSWRDLNQLIEKCIDVENIRFAIFHGLSDNRFKRLDISDARELVGYAPQDDFTKVNPLVKDLNLSENVGTHSAIQDGQKSGLREEL